MKSLHGPCSVIPHLLGKGGPAGFAKDQAPLGTLQMFAIVSTFYCTNAPEEELWIPESGIITQLA